MEWIQSAINYVQSHWVEVGIIALAIDQLLFVVSPITPWKWDDTLSGKLRVLVKKFFPEKP